MRNDESAPNNGFPFSYLHLDQFAAFSRRGNYKMKMKNEDGLHRPRHQHRRAPLSFPSRGRRRWRVRCARAWRWRTTSDTAEWRTGRAVAAARRYRRAGDAAGVTCVPTTGFFAGLLIGLPFASIRSTYLQPGRNKAKLHARRKWRSGVENCIAVLFQEPFRCHVSTASTNRAPAPVRGRPVALRRGVWRASRHRQSRVLILQRAVHREPVAMLASVHDPLALFRIDEGSRKARRFRPAAEARFFTNQPISRLARRRIAPQFS